MVIADRYIVPKTKTAISSIPQAIDSQSCSLCKAVFPLGQAHMERLTWEAACHNGSRQRPEDRAVWKPVRIRPEDGHGEGLRNLA